MKRILSIAMLLVLFLCVIQVNCYALSTDSEYIVEYFADGSYMTERLISSSARASGTKSGAKEKVYRNSDGDAQWKVTVTGTFTYTGSSSTCTASSCNVTIYDSTWYTISKGAAKSGNTATANATMGEKLLGVKVNEVSTTVTLKCDSNGTLS